MSVIFKQTNLRLLVLYDYAPMGVSRLKIMSP